MEERANILDEGIDRVQSVWNSAEDEFDRLQKNLQKRCPDKPSPADTQVLIIHCSNDRFQRNSTNLRQKPS